MKHCFKFTKYYRQKVVLNIIFLSFTISNLRTFQLYFIQLPIDEMPKSIPSFLFFWRNTNYLKAWTFPKRLFLGNVNFIRKSIEFGWVSSSVSHYNKLSSWLFNLVGIGNYFISSLNKEMNFIQCFFVKAVYASS